MISKNRIDELAVFGKEPLFAEKLHVGRPNIGNRQQLLSRINEILDRRIFTNDGPYVHEFEQKIARYVNVQHCIAMCNATVALEIVIRALNMRNEVIVPSFTFVATAHALQWQEITPVFCDIDPQTHNIDPLKVERLITPRTSGVIGVHVWGRPCNVEALETICKKHGLKLLFDAAHGFGCSYKGKMIGNFGEAEVYSFHATKFLNSFEGGAVVTNNNELAQRIRLMRNFGFAGYDTVIYPGINGKITEVCAAMGLTSLESIDSLVQTNYSNYQYYKEELANIPGVKFLSYNEAEKNNYQYVILEIDDTITNLSRDLLVKVLHAENILARRYFFPGCHNMEPYKSYFPNAGLLLPETEMMTQRVISLPTGTSISHAEIHEICQIIRLCFNNGLELTGRLFFQSQ